ncbi:hypothetical protein [uncultured Polaribacter sp.]|uniref:hypothetical protein n=1 Tax=uncultured Polaribacter sp. TaxID=174711 RepID=UPI00262070A9|nr:hypothetical protein [uncultured Polaribacter sp.]
MKTKFLKLGMVAALMLSIGALNAQTTDTTSANVIKDTPADGDVVRVIDNKGTIKYFQSNNGITTITSTSAGSKTTTTWQLGGTLTDDTYIDVDGNTFALDKLDLVDTDNLAASTDATDKSVHGTGTGFTLLVRDEATGATKKLLVSDLIESGHTEHTATAGEETANALAISVTDMPGTTDKSKVSVYRNGAKLRSGVDYTTGTDATVTLVPDTGTGPNGWVIYEGDIFEVYWSK